DFNKHVNNTKYVEWAIESLPEDIVKNYKLEEIKVTFEKECKYGEEIKSLSSFIKEEDGSLTTIHRIETFDNKELTKLIAHWRKY
ncbi:acyl-[acyl-carrier-protein] thioesterase, partial [Clostridium perfringens]